MRALMDAKLDRTALRLVGDERRRFVEEESVSRDAPPSPDKSPEREEMSLTDPVHDGRRRSLQPGG
jgi:hypothetical protein